MRHADREIRSVSDLIQHLKAERLSDQPLWLRGQSNAAWDLVP